ncbi:hypothetical protein [Serratia plymuthica]|uniref:Uncharacterized protein n=1 Tax=Serratia plymuthica TaxID=82996 RepID=A0A2X4U566_SERPL|nr:hypothetical protein [Serratia plymuthica]QPS21806.1 hypothetical protein I6G64_05150 [Serratia plymuthica]QPS54696.1 hypothetical protein I6G53_18745 [Serratia plymuthica]QPS63417.1 hypothetical protein I6G52_00940 [Serratia plymuthica]RKS64225.1 hypothetical protein C8E17_3541 [Serratia plymuthica]UNK26845.1 hypothetical protein MNO11_18690 [Serratia plymuthica]
MNDAGLESKLKENGLTDKEIIFIDKCSGREKTPPVETIRQLYRIFFGMSVLLLLLTGIAVYEFFNSEDFVAFLVAYIIAVVLLFLFTPMWLGVKVFLMVRKHGINYLL